MQSFEAFDAAVFWPTDKTPIEIEADEQLKKQHEVFWTADTIEGLLPEGARQWADLPAIVRGLLMAVLQFFAVSDSFANAITLERLLGELEDAPMVIKSVVSFHGMMEGIHADTYGRLLKLAYGGAIDRRLIYKQICDSPAVRGMITWGATYAVAGMGLAERMLGLVVYEGVLFTPLFAIIYAIKDKGTILKALCNANEYIARDELMHVNNALILIKWLRSHDRIELTETMVHDAFNRAYDCAALLMDEFLPQDLPEWSMIRRDFLEYTQMIANRIVEALGFAPPFMLADYRLPRCLKAMEVPQFTSFHSLKPTQYVLAIPASEEDLRGLISAEQRELIQSEDGIGEDD